MLTFFDGKYIKALHEINKEIEEYEEELKFYEGILDELLKNEPDNLEGFDGTYFQIERYKSRMYALRRLRDVLRTTID